MPNKTDIYLVRESPEGKEYREAWFVDGRMFFHEGTVGERGKTTVINTNQKAARTILESYQKQAHRDQYAEWETERYIDVVVILDLDETRSLEQLAIRHALEDELDEALGWTGNGRCTGGDFGGGNLQVFCETVSPKKAIPLIKKMLKKVKESFASIQVIEKTK